MRRKGISIESLPSPLNSPSLCVCRSPRTLCSLCHAQSSGLGGMHFRKSTCMFVSCASREQRLHPTNDGQGV